MTCVKWMKHGFVASLVLLLVLLMYVSMFVDRKTTTAVPVTTTKHQEPQSERVEVSKHIGQQLQILAGQLLKANSLITDKNEAHEYVQTSLNMVVEMTDQLGIKNPYVDVKIAGSQVMEPGKGTSFDVCPEKYLGKQADHPMYEKSRVVTNCTKAQPFSDVLSVLLNGFDYVTDDDIVVVIREIYASYPKLTVHVAVGKTLTIPIDVKLNVQQHVLTESPTASIIWNTLAEKATTDFVLVGRKIERFLWHAKSELERLVRVVSELSVDVVGGASRTPDGHWSLGCQQSQLAHYRLRYVDGYHRSRISCAFCDYVTSPFVSRLSTLRAVKFNMASSDVLFRDYFLRLKKLRKQAVSCPDVMFYIQKKNVSEANQHKLWVQLAEVHALNVLQFPDGKQLAFSCAEAKTSCKWRKGISVPICCLDMLTKLIQDTFDVCEKLGIFCRTNCGTTLGAIKFNGVLPWELDADISYTPSNDMNFWQRKDEFIKLGYTITKQYPGKCRQFNQNISECRKFAVRSKFWKVDIWDNTPQNVTKWLRIHRLKPTKVQIGDRWVNSLTNPGLYARNYFSFEVLKHVEHNIMTGHSNDRPMHGGHYIKCPIPGFHGCLDQSDADGNIGIIWN
ncbi:hypothetical protein NP493_2065g00008 [Ridgeia piscesae]|uniref:Uncharacterized protein n=1 Tax=Ridgeia piscesae TaxID=27915 RepID=A0AAD9N5B2_RIDPI|nr:hypothetical protein NP493_2065g00008 [Ridgeia piscesae]